MAVIQKQDLRGAGETQIGPPDLTVHESIADLLRLARQEHGQDLRTVSQVLRIRHAYLEAIEEGDFDKLPGTAYAIGFLRTYAEFLGLDGELIVERYKREVQGTEPKLDLVFPEPVGQNRIPGGAIVLISMVLLGLAYGGWFYLSNEGKSIADLMPPLPKSLLALISGDDDGQDGVLFESAPEMAVLATDGTEASTYIPPESAEAESHAPRELAALDVTVPEEAPAADFEAAPEVVQDAVAAPEAVETFDTPAAEIVETAETPAAEIVETTETPAAEIVETAETPAAEVVETTETPAPVIMAETAEPPAPPAPLVAIAPTTAAEPEHSVATGDSFLALTAVTTQVNHGTTTSAGSVEPMLDETVVIPAPPTASRDLVLSTERLPRVYGESNLGTRIVLRAVQDSWVQVRDRQDALLLTRVLRSGDTYYVPSQNGLTLLTGNAGGIVIEVDGVAVAPLGPVGAVRRQIALDPVRLLNGTAQRR